MPPSLFDFPFSWSLSIRPSQGRLILFGWELFAELCAMDSSRMETSPEDYSAPPHPDCCAPTPPTPRLAFPIPPPATAPVGGPAAATDRADCSAPLHPGMCKFSCFVSLCFVLMSVGNGFMQESCLQLLRRSWTAKRRRLQVQHHPLECRTPSPEQPQNAVPAWKSRTSPYLRLLPTPLPEMEPRQNIQTHHVRVAKII